MALGKQITGDNGAYVGQYHRIRTVVYDYDLGQCHIYIAHYADKQYREQEKAETAANQEKIARYRELSGKESLTEEERAELVWIEEDVRKGLYDRLGADVSILEGAEEL